MRVQTVTLALFLASLPVAAADHDEAPAGPWVCVALDNDGHGSIAYACQDNSLLDTCAILDEQRCEWQCYQYGGSSWECSRDCDSFALWEGAWCHPTHCDEWEETGDDDWQCTSDHRVDCEAYEVERGLRCNPEEPSAAPMCDPGVEDQRIYWAGGLYLDCHQPHVPCASLPGPLDETCQDPVPGCSIQGTVVACDAQAPPQNQCSTQPYDHITGFVAQQPEFLVCNLGVLQDAALYLLAYTIQHGPGDAALVVDTASKEAIVVLTPALDAAFGFYDHAWSIVYDALDTDPEPVARSIAESIIQTCQDRTGSGQDNVWACVAPVQESPYWPILIALLNDVIGLYGVVLDAVFDLRDDVT